MKRRLKEKLKADMCSKVLAYALVCISSVVVTMLLANKNAWPVICIYWCVLTLKNIIEVIR